MTDRDHAMDKATHHKRTPVRGVGRIGRIVDEIMTAHNIAPGDGPAQTFFPHEIEAMLFWAIDEAREARSSLANS